MAKIILLAFLWFFWAEIQPCTYIMASVSVSMGKSSNIPFWYYVCFDGVLSFKISTFSLLLSSTVSCPVKLSSNKFKGKLVLHIHFLNTMATTLLQYIYTPKRISWNRGIKQKEGTQTMLYAQTCWNQCSSTCASDSTALSILHSVYPL